MPTYDHICENKDCQHEWEDIYSITADPPKVCPKCNQETAKRMISDRGAGKDIVELSGGELVEKTKQDIKDLKSKMRKDEKLYANMLGEEKYHNLQTKMDQRKRDRR